MGTKRLEDIETYLTEAVSNIRQDRALTSTLLTDLLTKIKGKSEDSTDDHKEYGLIASKYVETLQRSNEQLVKISSLLHKNESKDKGLSEEDKSQLFDLIQESEAK